MINAISNLYPHPASTTRGLFNYQLFQELAKQESTKVFVPVAACNPMQFGSIRCWGAPTQPANNILVQYIPYLHIPLLGRSLSWRLLAYRLKRQPSLRQASPKGVLLASWLYPDGVAAAELAKTSQQSLWTMVLGTDRFHLKSRRRKAAIMQSSIHTTGYICVSQNIANDLINAGLPANKIHVIRNGVDKTRFQPQAKQDAAQQICQEAPKTKLPNPGRLFLWIGNMEPIKDPLTALRAFAKLKKRDNEKESMMAVGATGAVVCGRGGRGGRGDGKRDAYPTEMVFIGDGSLLPKLRQLASELGVSDSVKFEGRQPHGIIPAWLNFSDGLILSSRSEGMPNAIAEALACGIPVTATDVGACREMLADQPCCQIAAPANAEALADAMQQMLHEADQTERRPTFERTWADMAQEIADLMG